MSMRNLMVAASAVALLAVSSVAASAGSWNFSKGESYSGVLSIATTCGFNCQPTVGTLQVGINKSMTVGTGGGGAGSTSATSGGGLAGQVGVVVIGSGWGAVGGAGVAAAWGTTEGSSCAGDGCSSSP